MVKTFKLNTWVERRKSLAELSAAKSAYGLTRAERSAETLTLEGTAEEIADAVKYLNDHGVPCREE